MPTEALSSAHVLTIFLGADRNVNHAYNNRRHMCAADALALLVPGLLATAARACIKQLEISTVRMHFLVTHLHWPTTHRPMQQTQHCDDVQSHKQA